MAYIDELTDIRDQIVARIKEITAEKKPTYTIDGQSVSWNEYFDSLMKQLQTINAEIATGEPYEVQSTGLIP